MALARIIVCETTSKWAVALRRQMPPEVELPVYETRSLDDCWQQAVVSPTSVVLLEVTLANLERLASELPRYRVRLPHVSVVIVGSRRVVATEWVLRELGAVHVLFSSRDLGPLARIIRRHVSRSPQEPQDAAPWRQLPWGREGGGLWDGPRTAGPDWLVDGSC